MTRPAKPAAGARAPAPETEAAPDPKVGSKPEEPAKPEPTPEPITEFEAPPALAPSEPGPDDTMVTVETTGTFMFVDPTTLDEVPHDGSNSIRLTEYVKTAISDGRLKKVKK